MPESPQSPDRSPPKSVLSTHRTLVLGNDGLPVAFPRIFATAKQTITLLEWGAAETIPEWMTDNYVRSINICYQLPQIILLKNYRRDDFTEMAVGFSKLHLSLRDAWLCQYDGVEVDWKPDPNNEKVQQATMDHYIPASLDGPTNWENILLASSGANEEKKNLRPEKFRQPMTYPWVPNVGEISYLTVREVLKSPNLPDLMRPYLHQLRPSDRLKRVRAAQRLAA